jgi:hypothetical protein
VPEATPVTPPAAPAPPPAGAPPPAPSSILSTTTDGGAATAAGSTQQAAPGETPKGEPAKATEAPAELEIKLPQGTEADAALLSEFKPLVTEMGLKGEQAQKLFDFHVKALTQADQKTRASWEQTQKGWVESVKADKEYGGAQYEQNVKVAQKAIAKFGGPELERVLAVSGLGNHPELVRFAFRVGKAFAEDSVAATSGGPSTQTTDEARLRLQFPTMYPKD